MKWKDHRRWANKLGISDDVAEYVNQIIDVSNQNRLPEEYKRSIRDSADTVAANRGAKQGNSALSLVIAEHTMEHDAGRQKTSRGNLAAECTLEHLRCKGKDFVKAWYLHHHLDYLHEKRSTDIDLREAIMGYGEEYPKAHSQQIEKFLIEHEDTLATELGYYNE